MGKFNTASIIGLNKIPKEAMSRMNKETGKRNRQLKVSKLLSIYKYRVSSGVKGSSISLA